MDPESKKLSIVARWGPRCHLTLMIGVGLAMAYFGVHAAETGGGGWFAKLVAAIVLFILGFLGTHIWIQPIFRLISLAMYLRTYGFSSKGLKAVPQNDETDS